MIVMQRDLCLQEREILKPRDKSEWRGMIDKKLDVMIPSALRIPTQLYTWCMFKSSGDPSLSPSTTISLFLCSRMAAALRVGGRRGGGLHSVLVVHQPPAWTDIRQSWAAREPKLVKSSVPPPLSVQM